MSIRRNAGYIRALLDPSATQLTPKPIRTLRPSRQAMAGPSRWNSVEHDHAKGRPHHELRPGRVHRPDQRDIARGGMMFAVLMDAAGVLPAFGAARMPITSRRFETTKVRMASAIFDSFGTTGNLAPLDRRRRALGERIVVLQKSSKRRRILAKKGFGEDGSDVAARFIVTTRAHSVDQEPAENGGEGGIRTHVPITGQDAFEAPPLRPLRYLSVRSDRVKRTLYYTWRPLPT